MSQYISSILLHAQLPCTRCDRFCEVLISTADLSSDDTESTPAAQCMSAADTAVMHQASELTGSAQLQIFAHADDGYVRLATHGPNIQRWICQQTRAAVLQVFADADDEYAKLETVKARLATWQEKYPTTFRDAYGAASAPALFAPFVRLQLLHWDPLRASDQGTTPPSLFLPCLPQSCSCSCCNWTPCMPQTTACICKTEA